MKAKLINFYTYGAEGVGYKYRKISYSSNILHLKTRYKQMKIFEPMKEEAGLEKKEEFF